MRFAGAEIGVLFAGAWLVAVGAGCGSKTDDGTSSSHSDTKTAPPSGRPSSGSGGVTPPVTSALASGSSSSGASAATSSGAAPALSSSAVPLSAGAADRPKLDGAVAFVGKVGGDGPNLYAATLDKVPLELKKLSDGGVDWSVTHVSFDPTGKNVVFLHDHHEKVGVAPDEVWTAPLEGAAAKKVAKCAAFCRTPFFLDDGSLLFADYPAGFLKGTIRQVGKTGAVSAVYGSGGSVGACVVGLSVDPRGKLATLSLSNDMSQPDCTVDRVLTALSTDPKKTTMLPPIVPGKARPRSGEDGRVYFVVGTDDKPIPSSCDAQGKDIRSPDPAYDGKHVPRAGWTVVAEGAKLVAHPPAGDAHRPVELIEVDSISEVTTSFTHP